MVRLDLPLAFLLGALAAGLPLGARARPPEEPWPRIAEISVSGNEHTSDKVILRELDLMPGDHADPDRIDRGRQAVQDLGLFREVTVESEAVTDGVALRVRVNEKYHLLVLPRIDANADRDVSYGVQLRWSTSGASTTGST